MPKVTPAIQATLQERLARETARLKAQQRKIRALHEQRYLAVGRLLETLGCLWLEDADLEAIVRAGKVVCGLHKPGVRDTYSEGALLPTHTEVVD